MKYGIGRKVWFITNYDYDLFPKIKRGRIINAYSVWKTHKIGYDIISNKLDYERINYNKVMPLTKRGLQQLKDRYKRVIKKEIAQKENEIEELSKLIKE